MSYVSNTPTFEQMLANRPLKQDPETGKLFPEEIPWEVCQCGYLPSEDRDHCTTHGLNAQRQHQSKPQPQPQSQARRTSVGRTQPLYDVTAGSSTLDRIEDIVNRAIMDGEFTVQQRKIMCWALRKCRTIKAEMRELSESL